MLVSFELFNNKRQVPIFSPPAGIVFVSKVTPSDRLKDRTTIQTQHPWDGTLLGHP